MKSFGLLATIDIQKAFEKSTRQRGPISAYLFILVLGILFLCIKENKNIKGLNIFNHIFSYTAYPDDTTLFSKR